jgi:serine/threonine-protein kinase RsbW
MADHVLRFPSTKAGFERAISDLRGALDDAGVHGRVRYNTELVFEEVVSNVIRHARPNGVTDQVEVSLVYSRESIVLTFVDDGPPFDPLQQSAPSVPAALEEAKVGGWGLPLVRERSAAMEYERTADGRNRLTVTIASS